MRKIPKIKGLKEVNAMINEEGATVILVIYQVLDDLVEVKLGDWNLYIYDAIWQKSLGGNDVLAKIRFQIMANRKLTPGTVRKIVEREYTRANSVKEKE